MDQLFGCCSRIEDAFVGVLKNDDATAFDLRIVRCHSSGDKVCECDVGDEAPALVDLQPRLLAIFPFGNADLSVEHARVDADVRNGLGEHKRSAPRLALFTGPRWSRTRLVMVGLLRG